MFFGTLVPVYAAQFGGGVVWAAFGSAGIIFGLSAAYGAFTKNDLTQIHRILMLALVGLVVISLAFLISVSLHAYAVVISVNLLLRFDYLCRSDSSGCAVYSSCCS